MGAGRGLLSVAVVTGVEVNGLLAVVSNKSLSNQYFIHCLFRGHYNIMNSSLTSLVLPELV